MIFALKTFMSHSYFHFHCHINLLVQCAKKGQMYINASEPVGKMKCQHFMKHASTARYAISS